MNVYAVPDGTARDNGRKADAVAVPPRDGPAGLPQLNGLIGRSEPEARFDRDLELSRPVLWQKSIRHDVVGAQGPKHVADERFQAAKRTDRVAVARPFLGIVEPELVLEAC